MVDDFHNDYKWGSFMAGTKKISPKPRAINIEKGDPTFTPSTIFPNAEAPVRKDRAMVGILLNQNLGDARSALYPEK